MKMVQGNFIYSDFCNLVTINMNFTKHMKNMTNCGNDKFIDSYAVIA